MNYFKFNSLFFLLLLFYHNNSFAQIDLLKDFSKNTDVIFSKKNISNNEIYSGLNEALVISVKNSCNKASFDKIFENDSLEYIVSWNNKSVLPNPLEYNELIVCFKIYNAKLYTIN